MRRLPVVLHPLRYQLAAWPKSRPPAEQGNAAAQDLLGRLYGAGDDVAQDSTKAEEWYRKAVSQGLADAELDLGLLYQLGYRRPREAIACGHQRMVQFAHGGYVPPKNN